MKLNRIEILNAIGCRSFVADLVAPITVIAGPNGAGKSSIIQAVRFALTGDMPRISLKKEGEQLVTDGAKTGTIGVEWDNGGKALIGLPDCKLIAGASGDIHPAMPYLCDMHKFANSPESDRRSFLFGLTGTTASTEEVKKRLLAKKADPAKVESVLPLLRSGFPATHKEATGKVSEARGAWKAVTGEVYGSKKAEGWKAPTDNGTNQLVAADLPGLKADVAKLDADLEAETQGLGAANQARTNAQAVAVRQTELREKAGGIERIAAKLDLDRAELKTWTEKLDALPPAPGAAPKPAVTLPCPCCGEVLEVLGTSNIALVKYEAAAKPAKADPDADIKRKQYQDAVILYTRAVDAGERDLTAAKAAAESLKELEAIPPAESDDDIAARRTLIANIKERRSTAQAQITNAEAALRAVADADKKTKDAAQHHADCDAWTLIADALAPDGIPSELLAQALGPINKALAQSAADTGWMAVTIDADMEIRADGRPYNLCSESEQWRIDAMLAASIALLSGVKLILLDRLDVLDLPARKQAIGWLGVMAEAGEIHTAIVAATLKARPALGKDFDVFWLENGAIAEELKAAA